LRKRRVDWQKEIEKTERIRRRGLGYTVGGFLLAMFWMFGARQMGGELPVASMILSFIFIAAGVLIFFVISSRQKRKKRDV
jgi:hypothetical protein